jgi:hypothetical protein
MDAAFDIILPYAHTRMAENDAADGGIFEMTDKKHRRKEGMVMGPPKDVRV